MKNSWVPSILVAFAIIPFLLAGAASASALLDNVNLIGAPSVAPPAEFPFTTTTAEALKVTLTDLQAPAAFSSLQIAVTLGDTLVGSAKIDYSTTSTTLTATVALPAAIGNYVLHVIGTPVAVPNSTIAIGSFGACVARVSDPATCVAADSFSGNIEAPSPPSTTASSGLNTTFKSTTSGVYTITINDDGFPVALQAIQGGITQGSTPITTLAAGTNQVALTAGVIYTLIIGAAADSTAQAGLYGVHIADPSGTAILDQTQPVGTMPAATSVNNPSAQTLGLTLNDLGYPAALASVGVALTSGSTSLATLTAPGTAPTVAPAGSIQIWQYAVSSGTPGVYRLDVSTAANVSLYSTTHVVNPSATTGQSFAFVENLTAGGTYDVIVTDFQFPSALASAPTATVAQNGVVLPQSSTGAFTAAAGYIVVVVNAVPPASGSGIFGVTVETSGTSPQILLDQTQTVGGLFSTQSVIVGTSGGYDVTLTDLKFPGLFQDLAVLVSQGNQVLGKIYGGGTFSMSVVPGTYVFTFVDTPNSTDNYGLYSVQVAPSAPTITFTAGSTSVTAGQSVQLTWSSQNATACTASGGTGWTGSQLASGTLAVAVSATEALVLSCTGDGGSASQSVTITATAPAAKSGGGGGLDIGLLAALCALVVVRVRREAGRLPKFF
jgi:hypothetical protein